MIRPAEQIRRRPSWFNLLTAPQEAKKLPRLLTFFRRFAIQQTIRPGQCQSARNVELPTNVVHISHNEMNSAELANLSKIVLLQIRNVPEIVRIVCVERLLKESECQPRDRATRLQ